MPGKMIKPEVKPYRFGKKSLSHFLNSATLPPLKGDFAEIVISKIEAVLGQEVLETPSSFIVLYPRYGIYKGFKR
jgi:hypothetical protein